MSSKRKRDNENLITEIDFTLKEAIHVAGGGNIYCVCFCDVLPSLYTYFATISGRNISLFSIEIDNCLQSLKVFTTEDRDEEYYTGCWGLDCKSLPILVFAGRKGLITVLDVARFEVQHVLVGHGDAVNELRIHPLSPHLLFSASKDRSIRLWNLHSSHCIAIFAGEKGHTNEVITIDVHMMGLCFVSGGMDTSIKIWNLKDPILLKAVEASSNCDKNFSFKTCFQQIPLYSTVSMHSDYVDCVRWAGDAILSKSTKNRVVLWSPGTTQSNEGGIILQEYALASGGVWFVRLDVCIPLDIFAVGNSWGQVFVYPLSTFKNRYANLLDEKEKKAPFLKGEERFQCAHACGPLTTLYSHSVNNGHRGTEGGGRQNGGKSSSSNSEGNGSGRSAAMYQVVARQPSFCPNGQYLVSCFDGGIIQLWKIGHKLRGK